MIPLRTSAHGWPRKRRRGGSDEDGSVLLLTIGYAMLAIVLVLVCTDATSLYLSQKRLDSLADAAALAGADGFEITVDGGEARAGLQAEDVRVQAAALIDAIDEDAHLISADSPDGVSARVRVSDRWRPPVIALFVPEGFTLESEATSRIGLW